ncbi:MAG: hypothetical protein JNK68_13855 [Betaproteobacteria bacterium]|nr:hypothetical protein [Betaproteobacteria bacterium]
MLYAVFFLMSFALVRGHHDSPLTAGMRLAVIPVALGLAAPVSGGLADAWPRLMPVAGMTLCAAALVALGIAMTGADWNRAMIMAALAAFGAGLGMFIAPNNTATVNAAPPERSGQAGGLLSLLRVFGTGLGVATAAAVLSWRLPRSGGVIGRTTGLPESVVSAAVGEVLLMLVAFALLAAAASLLRPENRTRVRRPQG